MTAERKNTVKAVTFRKNAFAADFEITEVDDDNFIRGLRCKVCTTHLEAIRLESGRRNYRGAVLTALLNYVEGVKGAHRHNILQHVKAGGLHEWAKTTKGGLIENLADPKT